MTQPANEPTVVVVDPLQPQRNVMEIFLLLAVLDSSIRAVLTQPEPLSVEQLLGPVQAAIWGISLFGGSIITLIGLFWRGQSITALTIQIIGYSAFVPAALARTTALIGVGRPDESYIIGIFAIVCTIRAIQIYSRINKYCPREPRRKLFGKRGNRG